MNDQAQPLLSNLGFRFGTNGTHAARTMMLGDLQVLFSQVSAQADRHAYQQAIVTDNVLAKPTKKARELAHRHLASLYGLDTTHPLFRALRRLWPSDQAAQPVLALLVAIARDPLLRNTQDFLTAKTLGALVARTEVEDLLEKHCPDRFSSASLKSFAQNISGTWTAAGFLSGRTRKHRVQPVIRLENVVLSLFLGHLQGRSGQRLFNTRWMQLLGISQDEAEALAKTAFHRGYLVFRDAGGIQEVRFPDYLTPEEEKMCQEVSHVI